MMDGPKLAKLRADAGNIYGLGTDETLDNTDWQSCIINRQ
jgi:hypothetical protein